MIDLGKQQIDTADRQERDRKLLNDLLSKAGNQSHMRSEFSGKDDDNEKTVRFETPLMPIGAGRPSPLPITSFNQIMNKIVPNSGD